MRRWPRLVHNAALALMAAGLAAPFFSPDYADGATRQRTTTRAKAAPKGPQCPQSGTRTTSLGKIVSGTSFLTADGVEIRLAGVLASDQDGQPLAASQAEAARS